MINQWRQLKPFLRSQCKNCAHGKLRYSDEIKIPRRIPRGPTDILKALSSTVGRDPTAAHFKYHDDPYLMPHSNPSKRVYALAQEAGRKAAHWIRSEHADLFQHRVADPFIDAFAPKPTYADETAVNEDALKFTIRSVQVTDSMTIYELLKKKGENISPDVEQSLLELVCYYNADDPSSEAWVEERWFKQHHRRGQTIKKTWKDGGFAEKLFADIVSRVQDPSKAYCAIIAGMLSFGQVDLGWQRFEEARKKQVSMNTTVYNKVLSRAGLIRESFDRIVELIESLLKEMNAQGLQPNTVTLNSALEPLVTSFNSKIDCNYVLKLVAEFREIGVQPSLGTFYHLIEAYLRDKRFLESAMVDILNKVEGQSWSLVDPKDTFFFVQAMDTISNHVKRRDLALRLDSALHVGDNYNLIGDAYAESLYYRNFFLTLLKTGTLDEFMAIYDDLVPYVYIPEPNLMMEILNAVELEMSWSRLGKFWGDCVLFEHVERIPPMEKILNLSAQAVTDRTLDSSVQKTILDVVWSLWERMEKQTRLKWSGQMLGDAIFILTSGNELSKAHQVADRLFTSPSTEVLGEAPFEALRVYMDACIDSQDSARAMKCIQFLADVGYVETEECAKRVLEECALSDKHKNTLASLFPSLLGA